MLQVAVVDDLRGAICRGVPVLISASSGLGDLLRDRDVLDRMRADQLVIPVSDDEIPAPTRWTRAIEAVFYDRKAAFERAEALRRDLSGVRTWDAAVIGLLASLR